MAVETESSNVLTHEDGSPYRLSALLPTKTIFADTYDELLHHLYPSYPLTQETKEQVEEADARRYAFAVHYANQIQKTIVDQAWQDGVIGEDTQEGILWLLGEDRSEEITIPGNEWPLKELPLVLVSTNYYGSKNVPEGEILWIDPTSERTLVISTLTALGGEVFEHPESD